MRPCGLAAQPRTVMTQVSLELRACPICDARDKSRLYAPANVRWEDLDRFAFASRKLPEYMHWQLARCGRCDLVYADRAPAPDALAAFYRQADFASSREARLATRTYARLLDRFVHRLPDRDGAADIGTGDGAFLSELLARGFDAVVGIEPSTAPIELADPSIRPLIRHDVLREDSFAPGSLSLITCFQTIEHLPAPLSFCRRGWEALKPGGAMFLIGHNRRAMSALLLSACRRFTISNIFSSSLPEACTAFWPQRVSSASRHFPCSTAIRFLIGPSSSRSL